MQDVEGVNIYDILEPCYYPDSGSGSLRTNTRLPSSFRRLGETEGPHKIRKRMFGRAWPLRLPLREGRVPSWPSLSQTLFASENVPCTVCFCKFFAQGYIFQLTALYKWLLAFIIFQKHDQRWIHVILPNLYQYFVCQ